MKGVQYVVDDAGKQTAIQIDLSLWGELIEDFLDAALIRSREHEQDIPWEEAEKRLAELDKASATRVDVQR